MFKFKHMQVYTPINITVKRLARYLANKWTELHHTLVDDVVEDADELTRF